MKKISLMLLAALVAVMSYAHVPASAARIGKLQAPERQSISVNKVDAPRSLTKDLAKAPAKAREDYDIIEEQPEGELRTYLRSGGHYYVSNQTLYYGDQSGTIDIVFGTDGKVYFKDIVSGLTYGTWVAGDLEVAGESTIIIVPMGQNLYYSATYDACVALTWIDYDGSFAADFDHASATFELDEAAGTITLLGTGFATASVGATWTDDQTFQNYGDYESVYTPYEPNKELVELPAGLIPVEKPIAGLRYPSVDDDGVDWAGTAWVARSGDDFYFKGLCEELPDAWVVGTIEEGVITVPITYMGVYGDQDIWACGYSQDGPVAMQIVYLEDFDSYEFKGYLMLNPEELNLNLNSLICFYESLFIGERPEGITPPAELETQVMPISGELYQDGAYEGEVLVGFDGDDVYIQGLCPILPEAWAKGTLNADHTKLIIPSGEYMGYYDYYGCSVYLLGDYYDDETGESSVADIEFDYDEAKGTFTLVNDLYINASMPNSFYYIDVFLPGLLIGNECDVIWIAGKQGYENAQDIAEFDIAEDVHAVVDQAEGSNGPKYYSSGEALRLYAGNTLVISSERLIGKIEFTFTGTSQQCLLEADKGSYELEGKVGTWTGRHNEITFTVPNERGAQARIVSIKLWYFDYATTLCTPPADMESELYMFEALDANDQVVKREVQVGFADGEYFFQGFGANVPEGWASGELDPNNGVHVHPWLLGTYDIAYWTANANIEEEFMLQYDPDADEFTSEAGFVVTNLDTDDGYNWGTEVYTNVRIYKPTIVPAVPQEAEITDYRIAGDYGPEIYFTIPLEDAEGNELFESFLFYEFYTMNDGIVTPYTLYAENFEYLEEDMTRMPYTYDDGYDIGIYDGETYVYLNPDNMDPFWDAIGVKVIYTGGGEEHASEIVWFYPVKECVIALPEGVQSPEMFQGETLQLEVMIDDNASDTQFTWASSDESIATVDRNGLVTALTIDDAAAAAALRAPGDGTADDNQVVRITVTPRSNPSAAAYIDITVKPEPSGIDGIAADDIVSVRYVNAQGQVSNKPFEGFNIKVTKKSDGKTVTTKEIR